MDPEAITAWANAPIWLACLVFIFLERRLTAKSHERIATNHDKAIGMITAQTAEAESRILGGQAEILKDTRKITVMVAGLLADENDARTTIKDFLEI